MPFLKLGKKKDDEEDDIEAAEDDGLLMSTKDDQADPAGKGAPEAASLEPEDELEADATSDLEVGATEEAEEEDPLLEATLADPAAVVQESAEKPADTGGDKEADAADLMSAFTDDETFGDLAELIKDVEDVPAISLLEELREIRAVLPPEALDQGESVA